MRPSPSQQDIANRRRTTLEVSLDDLEQYSKDPELVTRVERNTQQYLTLLAEGADNRMPAPSEDDLPEDVFDVLLDQVRGRRRARGCGGGSAQPSQVGGERVCCLGQAWAGSRACSAAGRDCRQARQRPLAPLMQLAAPPPCNRTCLPACHHCSASAPRR